MMKSKTMVIVMLLALTAWGLSACEGKATTAPIEENGNRGESQPGFTVLAEKLKVPWALDFDKDTAYITERGGTIVKLEGKKLTRETVELSKPLFAEGEGGLLGFALAADFPKSKRAYAYHTYKENDAVVNRVVVLEHTSKGWKEVQSLLEGIPGYFNHNGGRIALGPDGKLYVTTGDSDHPELAQDLNSLAGKILRLNVDGSVPKDNPFPGSYVYSYGHRNPQGIAWNKAGEMYSTEHGPSGDPGGHDEVNRIIAGGNYGWPDIIGDAEKEGMIVPLYHTGDIALAPSGAAFDDNGKLLFAVLRGEGLYRFDPQTNGVVQVLSGQGRMRDVKVKDGQVYILTNNTDGRGTPSKEDDRLLLLEGYKD
ncbi:PQQ-dependent sugar dehydrogenase [Paenibacillus radicis (ex Gao et al. 2016)]|nr:PQQ-dependent sugar dehydrogenase [Paenibacillus radicis (ex Gao et al. 2016)]